MSGKRVTLYWDAASLERALAGTHNLTNRLRSALAGQGWELRLSGDDLAARLASAARPGWHLFHMAEPFHPRALNLRLAYFYPFWRVERSAERWEFEVAQCRFDPAEIDPEAAARFYRRTARRLHGDAPFRARREGVIYVPLQGQLLRQRSFQSLSPLDMVKGVLTHAGPRRVVAALHPRERYGDDELRALHDLAARRPALSITTGRMVELLEICDLVVTQNSGAALHGHLFGKPAVLCARSDFHHVAGNAAAEGLGQAMQRMLTDPPDPAAYLHWFLKDHAINAGAPEAEAQIIDWLRRRGWPG